MPLNTYIYTFTLHSLHFHRNKLTVREILNLAPIIFQTLI